MIWINIKLCYRRSYRCWIKAPESDQSSDLSSAKEQEFINTEHDIFSKSESGSSLQIKWVQYGHRKNGKYLLYENKLSTMIIGIIRIEKSWF